MRRAAWSVCLMAAPQTNIVGFPERAEIIFVSTALRWASRCPMITDARDFSPKRLRNVQGLLWVSP